MNRILIIFPCFCIFKIKKETVQGVGVSGTTERESKIPRSSGENGRNILL